MFKPFLFLFFYSSPVGPQSYVAPCNSPSIGANFSVVGLNLFSLSLHASMPSPGRCLHMTASPCLRRHQESSLQVLICCQEPPLGLGPQQRLFPWRESSDDGPSRERFFLGGACHQASSHPLAFLRTLPLRQMSTSPARQPSFSMAM